VNTQVLYLPPFRLDFTNGLLWRGERLIRLHPKAWAVLKHLIERSGQTISLAEIHRAIWKGRIISPGNVKVYIREIRKALADDPRQPRFIETIAPKGYRFIASPLTAPLTSSPHPDVHSTLQPPSAVQQPSATGDRQRTADLTGRAVELQQLYGRLNKALSGERQVVLLSGEPGIGKTTLVRSFQEQLTAGSPVWIALGCCIERYGVDEPYLPVLQALEQLTTEAKRSVLAPLLRQHAPTWLARLPSLLTAEDRERGASLTPAMTRERMLREFAYTIEVLTVQAPLVLILEDLHWSDYSTLDLVAALAQRREPARLLLIGTYRSAEIHAKYHPLQPILQDLQLHRLCTTFMLAPLTEAAVQTYLAAQFPGHQFPAGLARVLRQRTEGNPLLLTNLLDMFVSRGVFTHAKEAWVLTKPLATVAEEVPESFHLLLERQIARLTEEEQQLLAAASIAGQEFSAAAVAAVLQQDVVLVEEQCESLARRQQFLRPTGVSGWPDGQKAASYAFHHALTREVWSARIPAARKQRWHQSLGERLEAAYRGREEDIATELAMHFAEGRDAQRAARYHYVAGVKANQQLAYHEASSHFSQAVASLQALPPSRERSRQELRAQLARATPLIATKGWASPDTQHAYLSAHHLSEAVGSRAEQFDALFGLWVVAYTRAELHPAYRLAQQLHDLAQRTRDTTLRMKARHTLGNTLHRMGDLPMACQYLEQGIALHDTHHHRTHTFRYGLNDGVAGLGYVAWVFWARGYPEQAQKRTAQMLTLARELAHPLDIAWALNTAAWHSQFQRATHAAQRHADAALALCGEHDFTQLQAVSMIVKGWASAILGLPHEGIRLMEDGMAAAERTGAVIGRPRYLTALAETYGQTGEIDKALRLLTQAEKITKATEERFYEAELHRLRGEFILQQRPTRGSPLRLQRLTFFGADLQTEAKKCFRKAITVAQRQDAKLLELRAVVSLGRLLQRQHKSAQALQLLRPLYAWFTEGFSTADLREARALIDELKEAAPPKKRALPT
jgi:predicted ATPase/DNA-binding winged helix-turn-helix (wHTH) protein